MGSRPTLVELIGVAVGWVALSLFTDSLVASSFAVLWLVWKLLIVPGMPPVLPFALSFQWFQACGGMIYCVFFDRDLPTLHVPEYRTMVVLSLASVALIAIGIWIGSRLLGVRHYPAGATSVISRQQLFTAYVVLTVSEGSINQFAWQYPMLTQAIIAVALIRLGVLYLMLRHFSSPTLRMAPLGLLLAFEIALGFTGFFASFREPLAIAALVLYQVFDWRRGEHMAAVASLMLVAVLSGTVWMGVRGQFRAEQIENTVFAQSRSARFSRMADLVSAWFSRGGGEAWYDMDFFVDRMWTVYYPSLALARVPNSTPHTDGRFVTGAVKHVTMPRLLFPDKPELPSDSEKVREFSGVWVAGRDEGTSIAFGYVIESYVDYGVPRMFIPIAIYGVFMGMAFALFTRWIRTAEFGVPLLTVVFWLGLYLFEESWAKKLGDNLTMFLYLGGLVFLLERLMRSGRLGEAAAPSPEARVHADLYPATIGPPAAHLSPRKHRSA
ncbi:MAG TPA: hypothetical protein VMO26_28260 [Vicinamibacterales bacterium]|nr:hypothetical protein [Vicinamibacterales bacterium]